MSLAVTLHSCDATCGSKYTSRLISLDDAAERCLNIIAKLRVCPSGGGADGTERAQDSCKRIILSMYYTTSTLVLLISASATRAFGHLDYL